MCYAIRLAIQENDMYSHSSVFDPNVLAEIIDLTKVTGIDRVENVCHPRAKFP